MSRRGYFTEAGLHPFFYFKEASSYGDRVDEFFTLYRSIETRELTGCQIKGVQCILKRLGAFGVRITDKTVDLRIIFLGYRASVDDSSQAEIDELVQAAEEADAHLDTEELIPA
jgi:hypothetical protein